MSRPLRPIATSDTLPARADVQYGLPVLARVDAGTDLAHLIEDHGVGEGLWGDSTNELKRLAEQLADDDALRYSMSERGRPVGRTMFSPETAAMQIVSPQAVP